MITIRRMLPDRGEVRLPRVEGLAVSGSSRHGAGASVSTLATFPLPARRTERGDFPHWALARDHALAHAKPRRPPSGVPFAILRLAPGKR